MTTKYISINWGDQKYSTYRTAKSSKPNQVIKRNNKNIIQYSDGSYKGFVLRVVAGGEHKLLRK